MSVKGYEWESDFAKSHRAEGRVEGREEGRVEGEVKALLLLLEARGIPVTDDVRDRVEGCTDLGQIERWIQRVVTADTADDLFA
ncbi:hypothetical protein [Actinomadura sp. 3N407]|uniref:hypothetical protein n=1 Tax=Actinomadura sp. 3N407 TaxID=3457423 RepID=UPI003FCE145A